MSYFRDSETPRGIQRPQLAKVSLNLIRNPPFPKDRENGITTLQLNALLIIVNCAQQLVEQQWERTGKAHWRAQATISYVLPVARLARYCGCKPKRLLTRLRRFTEPVGRIPMGRDRQQGLITQHYPPPIAKFKQFTDNQGRQCVSITLNMPWVHTTDLFTEVPLNLPTGPNKCRRYLEQHNWCGGMS